VRMDANKMMRQLADLLGVEMVLKAEAEKHMQYLQTVPLLKHLSAVELNKVVQSMQVCRFSIGQTVIVQGEIGNDMFVVESGRAACTKEGENGGEPIAHYSAGEFFGERSLLANEPRSATITAESDLCTLRLDRTAYELILESSREAGAQIEMLQKQYNRLDFYHRTAGAVVGRSGGFGQVGGPTVSQVRVPGHPCCCIGS
jgi:signal-transduction protein with cAMP-binding, CBS, and nucleotidyltransferase domain